MQRPATRSTFVSSVRPVGVYERHRAHSAMPRSDCRKNARYGGCDGRLAGDGGHTDTASQPRSENSSHFCCVTPICAADPGGRGLDATDARIEIRVPARTARCRANAASPGKANVVTAPSCHGEQWRSDTRLGTVNGICWPNTTVPDGSRLHACPNGIGPARAMNRFARGRSAPRQIQSGDLCRQPQAGAWQR